MAVTAHCPVKVRVWAIIVQSQANTVSKTNDLRMDSGMLKQLLVSFLQITGQLLCATVVLAMLWANPGPPAPPKPPPPDVDGRLADISQKLKNTKPVDDTARRALQYSQQYLNEAKSALNARNNFAADRLAGAADALIHIAEHQQHLRDPDNRPVPPPDKIRNHLQRVYFRVRQSDYFVSQAHDPRLSSFPRWARDFYQLAIRACDRGDWLAADENGKCAEEVTKVLENLAQAAMPSSPEQAPPPPPELP
jgi:hypothetical protein